MNCGTSNARTLVVPFSLFSRDDFVYPTEYLSVYPIQILNTLQYSQINAIEPIKIYPIPQIISSIGISIWFLQPHEPSQVFLNQKYGPR